ncbi:MAG TPA: TldD/PmbA family protein [Candidatus Eisenbacteria bacterium]|jgi:PmbA protein
MPAFSPQDLVTLVRQQAERAGAAEAEVFLEYGSTLEVRVRQRETELVQQSSARGLGLRVFSDRRMGFAYTTDLRRPVLDELVIRTIALASQATPREENRLPTLLFQPQSGLEIEDPAISALRVEDLKSMARSAEDSAFGQDMRIQSTRDARAGVAISEVHFGNTYIPYQTYRGTTLWLSVTAIATQDGQKREGEYADRKRTLQDLATPERVGKTAAQRALARLDAAPRASMRVPVVFEAEAAGAFLSGLFGAFSGANVLEQRSYLSGRLGQPVASPLVTIIDDGLMRRGLGTAPFDGEGVECRRTVVVDRGVLESYLETAISARRRNVPPTGNGFRAFNALPTVQPSNLYIEEGNTDPEKIVKGVSEGLYVTDTAGFGFDLVGGEYSQQVVGQWIENGVRTGPVEGITVAGRLDDMLLGVDAVGNRVEFRNRVAAPSLRFRELTIGGA